MSNVEHQFRISPIRSIREFLGGNDWAMPTLNPKDFGQLQQQVIENLIYFQSNYGIVVIPFFLFVAFFRPTAILLGLIVLVLLLFGFVYSNRQTNALSVLLHDRPIVVLILLLVGTFMIIRIFGTVFIFLIGIALPLSLIVLHATARIPTSKIKAENVVEKLSLQTTPMGLLLGWLGAQNDEPSSTKRR